MAEIEAPTELIEEQIHHEAHRAAHSEKERWVSQVALSSAFFAVFAAIAALLANHHANEAMIDQIQASDHWGYYQAKGIKSAILGSKIELLQSLGKKPARHEEAKLEEYKKEQEQIAEKAREKEEVSEQHLHHHVILARGVTLFQVAIAIAAISVLSRRKRYWYVSLGFATVGLGFVVQGLFISG